MRIGTSSASSPAASTRAAARFAQHAEAVGVVHEQPRALRAAGRGERAERRDVAVHAEHAVGHDHRAPVAAFGEARGQCLGVAMRIAREAGAARESRVEQRGVVQAVHEHPVAAPEQCRDHGEVGHVARREQQRPRPAGEGRELVLQRVVFAAVPAHEVRRPAAHAPFARCVREGRDDARVAGEAEVVVAAEGQQRRPFDADVHAVGRARLDDAPPAHAAALGEPRQARLQRSRERIHRAAAATQAAVPAGRASAASPSRANSASSRLRPGLGVVSSRSP